MILSPVLPYNGLHIVLSRASRFDDEQHTLLSGYAGDYFFNGCLGVTFKRFATSICDASAGLNPPPGTKLILLLGDDALHLLDSKAQLNAWRGSPLSYNGINVIASYAPQDTFDRKNYDDDYYEDSEDQEFEDAVSSERDDKDLQRTKRRNFKFWLYNDVKKAVNIYYNGVPKYAGYDYKMMCSSDEIINELLSHKDCSLVVDIETNPETCRMLCFGFTFIPKNVDTDTYKPTVYSVPLQRFNNTLVYDEVKTCRILSSLALAFSRNTVIGHNLGFDLFVLAHYYKIPIPRCVFDTMLAQHRVSPETEKSLGHCISRYLYLPYHKDEGIFTPHNQIQEQQLWAYNAKDVYTTALLPKHILNEAARINAVPSINQANESLPAYLTISLTGARVDVDNFCKAHDDFRAYQLQLERLLKLVVGYEINPRSPKQVSSYLYETCKLKRPLEKPTDKGQLIKLYLKSNLPSLQLILQSKLKSKLASAMEFKFYRENRATCSYLVAGTDTLRLGSRALLRFRTNKGIGTNMQNWSKKLRRYIIPDPGKVFIQIDQAGAEALIVAYLVKPGNFRSLFLNKIKPHVFVAMHMVPAVWATRMGIDNINAFLDSPVPNLKNIPNWAQLERLIKDSDNAANPAERYYYIGKTGCHSSNYHVGPGTLQKMMFVKSDGLLRVDYAFAKNFLGLYTGKLFPEIPEWWAETESKLKFENRILRNLFGFPRRFNGSLNDDSVLKAAYAFVPQSTVGSITNIALTEIQNDIENGIYPSLDILQNGHDSGLFQCNEECAMDYAAKLVKHFRRPLVSPRGEPFNMGAEVQIGMNWQPASEKNPDGMKEVKI